MVGVNKFDYLTTLVPVKKWNQIRHLVNSSCWEWHVGNRKKGANMQIWEYFDQDQIPMVRSQSPIVSKRQCLWFCSKFTVVNTCLKLAQKGQPMLSHWVMAARGSLMQVGIDANKHFHCLSGQRWQLHEKRREKGKGDAVNSGRLKNVGV